MLPGQFRIEDLIRPLQEIHDRMHALLSHDIHPSTASADPHHHGHGHGSRTTSRPFILHRNQWRRLLHAYSCILRHITDLLSSVLLTPLQSLLSAMASAEQSFKECVAPHIHESYVVSTLDGVGDASGDGDGDDKVVNRHLTDAELSEVQLWLVQKALKHALSSEVPYLHVDNLLTSSMTLHEALSNYSTTTHQLDIAFHQELAAQVFPASAPADMEQAVTEEVLVQNKVLSNNRRRRNRRSECYDAEDLTSTERFFAGREFRQKIGDDSSPSSVAAGTMFMAHFVLQRIRNCKYRFEEQETSTAFLERLRVDPSQFSDVIVKGQKAEIGRGAMGTVVRKKWMVDGHTVAVKETVMGSGSDDDDDDDDDDEKATDDRKLNLMELGCREIVTQARVYHPNLLPLLCFTQESKRYNYDNTLGYNAKKVMGLAMEEMALDLAQLIESRKTTIKRWNQRRRRHRIEGGTAPFLAVAPFPLHVSVEIMLQIAKGMEYLHRQHIMHRDLKPANILITAPDSVLSRLLSHHDEDDDDIQLSSLLRVKIADFGISKFVEAFHNSTGSADVPSKHHTANVGTGIWRAPEVIRHINDDDIQFEGKNKEEDDDTSKYSTKADVYSFAMVCYQILTGRVPFDGERCSGPLLRSIRKELRRPKFPIEEVDHHDEHIPRRRVDLSCPPALVDMIRHCWHLDTSVRPSFTHIANYLRYMKICAIQLVRMNGGKLVDYGPNIIHPAQYLIGKPLFSIFRSKNLSFKLEEMRMESRRIVA